MINQLLLATILLGGTTYLVVGTKRKTKEMRLFWLMNGIGFAIVMIALTGFMIWELIFNPQVFFGK